LAPCSLSAYGGLAWPWPAGIPRLQSSSTSIPSCAADGCGPLGPSRFDSRVRLFYPLLL
jgi:hypothetical protein